MFTPIPCIVTSSQYLRQLSLMYLRSRLPWLVAPLLLCSALSAWMSDVRWAVVGLMLLFIVIPMVLALAYINYALSAEARWSLLNKTLTLTNEGIALHFEDNLMHDRVIPWSDVTGVALGGDAFLVMLRVRRFTFVMIPFDAVEQAGIPLHDFAQCLWHLAKKSA